MERPASPPARIVEVRARPEAGALRPGRRIRTSGRISSAEQPARAAAFRATLDQVARAGTPHRRERHGPNRCPSACSNGSARSAMSAALATRPRSGVGRRSEGQDPRVPARQPGDAGRASGAESARLCDRGAAQFEALIGSGIESFEAHLYLARSLAGMKRRRSRGAAFRAGGAPGAARRRGVDGLGRSASGDRWTRSRRWRSFARAGTTIRAAHNWRSLEADLCLRLRRPDEAVAAFQVRRSRCCPTMRRVRQQLGELQRDLGQIDAALASLRDAVAVDATNASAWNALGMTLGGSGRLNEAEEAFREAIARNGTDHRYHLQSRARPGAPGPRPTRRGRRSNGRCSSRPTSRRRETSFASLPPSAVDRTRMPRDPSGCSQLPGPSGRWIRRGRVDRSRPSPRSAAAGSARRADSPARASSGPAGPRNLLLVSLDTVRADRLGSYHYAAAQTPQIDALASVRPAIRAGDDGGAAHAAGALVADDRHVSRLARRARQRRLLP